MSNMMWTLVAFVLYVGVMIAIGSFFFKKSDSLNDYFLGGRQLNSWVAAFSAQASDMSGWLLMGLPGAVYAFGTNQVWIAVGLALGTALNWILVAKRLRRYTIKAGDAITMPQYFENRFHDTTRVLRVVSSVVITVFFTVYTASAFVAGGTLFSQVFGIPYSIALSLGALIILVYTFLGGFSAVSWTDMVQGALMLVAILSVPILALVAVGGQEALTAELPSSFLSLTTTETGESVGAVSIISQLAWGLGYFGMPHILVRFMAIRREKNVNKSATIAIIWVVLSLVFSVFVGIVGRAFLPGLEESETVFIAMIQEVFMQSDSILQWPLVGGLFLCGILAAIMSTADSQLLVTAASITGDIYRGFLNPKASDRHYVWFSRVVVAVVALVAYLIAMNPSSGIMSLVANAWSGFGSAFGALVLLSLYWKKVSKNAAVAGIVAGGLTVVVWDYLPIVGGQTPASATGLYSLVPGFALSLFCIVVVSLLSKKEQSEALEKQFEEVFATPLDEELQD